MPNFTLGEFIIPNRKKSKTSLENKTIKTSTPKKKKSKKECYTMDESLEEMIKINKVKKERIQLKHEMIFKTKAKMKKKMMQMKMMKIYLHLKKNFKQFIKNT